MRYSKQLAISAVALVLIIAGIAYVALPKMQHSWNRNQGRAHNAALLQDAKKSAHTEQRMEFGTPALIRVPRLGIELSVLPGYYNQAGKTWTLDREHAYIMQPIDGYAPASPVIYGHDIPAVFEKLHGVAKDEVLHIATTDGRLLLFRFTSDKVVAPHDSSVLTDYTANTVYLMTCTGPTFDQRRIFQFTYVGEQIHTAMTGRTL